MAFCFQCGTAMQDGAAFCPKCGTRQGQPVQPQQQPVQQQPVQQPRPYQQPVQPGYVAQQVATAAVQTVKKTSALAKWLVALAILAAAAVAVFTFTDLGKLLKTDEQLIRERIEAYEQACNDGDYEGMLECMDEGTRNAMDATMGIVDGLFSEGTGLGVGMTDLFGLAGAMGDYSQIEITDIDINGDHATVDIVMSIEMFGASESQEATLPMVKEGLDWYIGGIDNMFSGEDFDLY